jgi:signal transduction histidine kinase
MLVQLETTQLSVVVELVKAVVEPVALQKNIALLFQFEDHAQILADSNMLQTILRNLLSNAVKFTPLGGTIILSAERVDSNLMIRVQDNGVGIRPDNLKRLFRIDSPFSTHGTSNEFGSGLGLIICRDFLKKMNSELLVESQVGKGSTFSFLLPLA